MNLPFFKKFNKKILPSYFLALILRDERVNAVVFEEIEGIVKVIGQEEEYFSSSIDQASPEEFLQTLDKAISQAEISLPENIQTQKTIFGVKESWVAFDQIKKDCLIKLKKASEELGLIPIGFLVISQAISHLLQKEEGAPVSAILVEINKKNVTVTLLRAGKSIEAKTSDIHESIPFTVDTLLKHFNIPEILPSRIIIFNGKEDLSQEFISHTWSKSLPFLHLPQITNLPEGFDAKAVLFGAATQMGFEVLEKDVPKEEPVEDFLSKEETQTVEEKTLDKKPTLYENLGASDFGFAKDIDVAKIKFQEIEEKQPARFASESVAGEETIPQIDTSKTHIGIVSPKNFDSIISAIKTILISILGITFGVVGKINIKKIFSFVPGKLAVILPVILILIVTLIASYFLFLKATIAIIVDPKISEQNKSVLFSTTGTTNPSKNIIKGEFVSVSEVGNASAQATGKKDVGTNAKGSVTIFNLSDQKNAIIPSGTKIVSTNNIEFILDNSVNLASASSSVDTITLVKTIKPTTTNVNATANQLGKESNLPSGTKFSVSSFDTSDLIAKNDNPFSGGTKKEVTVASKNDSVKLEDNLLKQLENKAKEDLQKQLAPNKILLPAFITETLSKKSLNVKVGDETSKLSLNGTVEYQGLSYDKNDLVTFSKSLLEKDIPPSQEIDYSNIKAAVLDIKSKNDKEIEANLNIKTLLLPKIDKNKLIKNLKGKSFKTTEDALYKLPQVANVDIKISPNLPLLPKNLPSREKNIIIKIIING